MSGLPFDPIGEGEIEYKRKLKEDRKNAINIEIPFFDEREKRWIIYLFPYFPIPQLEYGPWDEDHPVYSHSYPPIGSGAPNIGSGGVGKEDQPQPGPGSGQPGTPLYPPYGEGEEKGGIFAGTEPVDPIYGYGEGEIESELDELARDLELEFLKPSKKLTEKKFKYTLIKYSGPKSMLDWDATIEASIENSQVWAKLIRKEIEKLKNKINNYKELDPIKYKIDIEILEGRVKSLENILKALPSEKEFKIEIRREDERYIGVRVKEKSEKNAVVIYIRDVSGSITDEHLKASLKLTKYIDKWLEKFYPKVERVYIAHNYDAWEETKEGYEKLVSGGGTRFASAYEIILSMFEGKDYPRKTERPRKINSSEVDVYVVQMTDGFGMSPEEEVKPLKRIMPEITRFCYLEERIDYSQYSSEYLEYLKQTFPEEYNSGKLRISILRDLNDIRTPLKDFFGKK